MEGDGRREALKKNREKPARWACGLGGEKE